MAFIWLCVYDVKSLTKIEQTFNIIHHISKYQFAILLDFTNFLTFSLIYYLVMFLIKSNYITFVTQLYFSIISVRICVRGFMVGSILGPSSTNVIKSEHVNKGDFVTNQQYDANIITAYCIPLTNVLLLRRKRVCVL